LTREIPQYSH